MLILFSCTGQSKPVYVPVPDKDFHKQEINAFKIGSITETRDGNMPPWLRAFFNGGIAEIERGISYQNKYLFVVNNEGININALLLWADNFTAEYDFAILAADRIEKRMISSASLYPDNEYGLFFATMIKNAHNAEYSGAVKEDTYWVKTKPNNNDAEIYNIFILLGIDKRTMQSIINNMSEESLHGITLSADQKNSVNRLRQNFFTGF